MNLKFSLPGLVDLRVLTHTTPGGLEAFPLALPIYWLSRNKPPIASGRLRDEGKLF